MIRAVLILSTMLLASCQEVNDDYEVIRSCVNGQTVIRASTGELRVAETIRHARYDSKPLPEGIVPEGYCV